MNDKINKRDTLKGFILSNLFAFTLIRITKLLKPDPGILVYAEFVILPLMMGIISAWCWRSLKLSGKRLVGYSCLNGLLAILLSAILLGEGAICLLIVSPLILGFIITGASIGKMMFQKRNNYLNVSIFSLLFVLFIIDSISTPHYENLVSDVMVIDAPPEEVWKHVVAFDGIEEDDEFWLFRIGMPMPIAATVNGYYEGAERKCIFSNGYTFDEKIVTYQPKHNLTFDIVNQPKDPEIMGHIDILKGQFLLKDNGDGTTTLTGNSWYRLYVFPVWYYDIWAESITRNVHLRVMKHIKQLSEKT